MAIRLNLYNLNFGEMIIIQILVFLIKLWFCFLLWLISLVKHFQFWIYHFKNWDRNKTFSMLVIVIKIIQSYSISVLSLALVNFQNFKYFFCKKFDEKLFLHWALNVLFSIETRLIVGLVVPSSELIHCRFDSSQKWIIPETF
jgi:hypothetical protein